MTDISLLGLVNVFLRHRWRFITLSLGFAAVLVLWSLSQPRTYSASARFMPQSQEGRTSGAAAGLARQFGISMPTERLGESPQFYAELLKSRELLRSAVEAEYQIHSKSGGGEPITLVEYLEAVPDGILPAWRVAVERLRERLTVTTNTETGSVELIVSLRSAVLSEQVAGNLVDLVNRFNLENRQSQARVEAEFVSGRLQEARHELREVEAELEGFLRGNREFRNSPELLFEHDRLQRNVALRQEVVSSLVQGYEQARIDAVRDIPVLTVLAPAAESAQPDSRGTIFRALFGLLLGFMAAATAAFISEANRSIDTVERDDYREFRALRREAWADLRHPIKRFGRRFRRNQPV